MYDVKMITGVNNNIDIKMKTENFKRVIKTDILTEWLNRIKRSISTESGVDVECDECRACCTSSYFIHIQKDELKTLSLIPKNLLFPAPGLPEGNYVLGYDKNGHCPMFIDNNCSIYKNRPRTCRNFDCRVLTATGIFENEERQLINYQAHRWNFNIITKEDYDSITALKYAGKFIIQNENHFPTGFIPKNAIQKSILAIRIHEVFLEYVTKSVEMELSENIEGIIKLIVNKYKESIKENE